MGPHGLKNNRKAPSWFRGVHNYWPVLLTHAQADLISLFTNLVEREQRSDYPPEFCFPLAADSPSGLGRMARTVSKAGRVEPISNKPCLAALWCISEPGLIASLTIFRRFSYYIKVFHNL
jgi:hypothetical protein